MALVTSNKEVFELTGATFEVPDVQLVITDNPQEFGRMVEPRWSRLSLMAFQSGNHTPDPQGVYEGVRELVAGLIDFHDNPVSLDLVCLFILMTYFYQVFGAVPYLFVFGPKGSGKTKLAMVIDELAFNPLRADSIKDAGLFRVAEITAGTLILDEEEGLGRNSAKSDRGSLLRGGYKRGGTSVRAEKDRTLGFAPKKFNTYCPKVIIHVSGVEEMLADRCIAIKMARSKSERGKAQVNDFVEGARQLRDEFYCHSLEVFQDIQEAFKDPGLAPTLNNRQREKWLPLLALARVFVPGAVATLLAAAQSDETDILMTNSEDRAFLLALDSLVECPAKLLNAQQIGLKMANILEWEEVRPTLVGTKIKNFFGNVAKRSGSNGNVRYTITRELLDRVMEQYDVKCEDDSREGSQQRPVDR